jgi:hypothetical protein
MTKKKRSKICAEVTDESTPQSKKMTDATRKAIITGRRWGKSHYEFLREYLCHIETEQERRLKATGLGKELF